MSHVRRRHLLGSIAAALTVMAACSDPRLEIPTTTLVSKSARVAALAGARVWHEPTAPADGADFSGNGSYPGVFAAAADVDCDFEYRAVSGTTPKFYCRTAGGERLKVKYGPENPELAANAAAARLLDTLGFAVDRMNLVHSVRCRGCPPDPFTALVCASQGQKRRGCFPHTSARRTVTFPGAMIERTYPGREINAVADQGWSWYELDDIHESAGGARRPEIDALRLMAVLLAHWDNKGSNQRLVCPVGQDAADGGCRAAVAVAHDLGATFGPLKADLANWRRVPVWDDARTCRVSMSSLPFQGATFGKAVISEEGRQLALRLLRSISTGQLDALFASSGLTRFGADAAAWTAVFESKVDQIAAGGPCPATGAPPIDQPAPTAASSAVAGR